MLIDIIGWAGSVAVVLAYALLSMDKLTSRSLLYQWLNIAGSICLIINTAVHYAYPSTFVNIIWLIIAALAIVKILRTKSKT